jgi:hypothetical protein
MPKKEILIIFLNGHLAYSPSTLNIFYALKNNYNVKLVCPNQPKDFSENEVIDTDIEYFNFQMKRNILDIIKALFHKISDLFIKPSTETLSKRYLSTHITQQVISYIKKTDKEIIAVDTMALWCAQQAGKKAHLLSLEIL